MYQGKTLWFKLQSTWLWTYLWFVLFDTNFWQILQNPALVPWVVLDVLFWGPVKEPLVLPKSIPDGLLRADFCSGSLLLSLFPGKLSKSWPKVSAGVNWDKLRRRFLFIGAKLSKNSRLTVIEMILNNNFSKIQLPSWLLGK